MPLDPTALSGLLRRLVPPEEVPSFVRSRWGDALADALPHLVRGTTSAGFYADVCHTLRRHGVPERTLLVALRERASGQDPESLARVRSLAQAGWSELPPPVLAEDGPFRPLRPFSALDIEDFAGRGADAAALAALLHDTPIVTLVGASGAGKSSLLQVGLAPAWPALRLVWCRPGAEPLQALARTLADLAGDWHGASTLMLYLRSHPERLTEPLCELAEARGVTLTLVVDQAEGLVELCRDPDKHAHFAKVIRAWADDHRLPLRVVLSVRDGSLGPLSAIPALRDPLVRQLYVLPPLEPARVREMITKPLARRGYQIETRALLRDIVQDALESASPLPALQVCLAGLWQRRDVDRQLLTRSAYEALGGVQGALSQHAERVYAALSDVDQATCRRAFLLLVSQQRVRVGVPWGRALATLGDSAAPLLERLVRDYLLLDRLDEAGARSLELAHDALLTGWPRLEQWLEGASGLHRRLEQAPALRVEGEAARRLADLPFVFLDDAGRFIGGVDPAQGARLRVSCEDGALHEPTEPQGPFTTADLCPEGERLVLGAQLGGTLAFLDLSTGAAADAQGATGGLRGRAPGAARILSLQAGRRLVVTGHADGRLGLWTLPEGALKARLASVQPVGLPSYLRRWQLDVGMAPALAAWFVGAVLALTSPYAGAALIAGLVMLTVILALDTSNALTAVAVSEDERWLAAANREGQLFVWDAASEAQVFASSGRTRSTGLLRQLCFSPEGDLLCAGLDGVVHLWRRTQEGWAAPERLPIEGFRSPWSEADWQRHLDQSHANAAFAHAPRWQQQGAQLRVAGGFLRCGDALYDWAELRRGQVIRQDITGMILSPGHKQAARLDLDGEALRLKVTLMGEDRSSR